MLYGGNICVRNALLAAEPSQVDGCLFPGEDPKQLMHIQDAV
jgi:hypothetical protein